MAPLKRGPVGGLIPHLRSAARNCGFSNRPPPPNNPRPPSPRGRCGRVMPCFLRQAAIAARRPPALASAFEDAFVPELDDPPPQPATAIVAAIAISALTWSRFWCLTWFNLQRVGIAR